MRHKTRYKNQGWLITELAIGLTILMLMIVGWTKFSASTSRFNTYQLSLQRCNAAALAQLESVTATGRAMQDADIEKLWPGVQISTAFSPGENQWKGLTLAEVTATARNEDKTITVTQARYVIQKKEARP